MSEGPAGTVLLAGRYRLQERLAEQDGSAVWMATDESLARSVTVCTFAPGFPRAQAAIAAARAAAGLSDPRLVQIFDADDRGAERYIVTEWPAGERLDEIIAAGPLEARPAAGIVEEVAGAVAVAHTAGLSHLCLTPDLVRRNRWGDVKLSGVGTAAALAGADDDGDPAVADTRGLARLLYAALTGYWPGPEQTRLPAAPRSDDGRPDHPGQIRPGITRDVDAVVCRALFGEENSYGPAIRSPAGLAVALGAIAHPTPDTEPLGQLAGTTAVFDPVPPAPPPLPPGWQSAAAPPPTRQLPVPPEPEPAELPAAPVPASQADSCGPATDPGPAAPVVPMPDWMWPADQGPARAWPADPAVPPGPMAVSPGRATLRGGPARARTVLSQASARSRTLVGAGSTRARAALSRSGWLAARLPRWPALPAAASRPVRTALAIIILVASAIIGWALGRPAGPARSTAPAGLAPPPAAHDPAPRGHPLNPAGAAVYDPYGDGHGGQLAALAIDASPATAWRTSWYTTAQFGNLKPGTGLLVDMGQSVTITGAAILLGHSGGADFQLRVGPAAALGQLHPVAQATDAGGAVRLRLARPAAGRYLLIWFTRLPPDNSGTFEASIYNISVQGTTRS